MSNLSSTKSIALFCREGSSDKEYRIELKESDGGFLVNYANGRRGGSLQHGTKTPSPVAYDKAVSIYDKVVREKKGKGYVEQEGALSFSGEEFAGRHSGIRVQLLTPVLADEVDRLIADDRYGAQEKHDGERRPTVFGGTDGNVGGANKKGLTVALRSTIAEPLHGLGVTDRTVLDGEEVGDTYHCFDAIEINGVDLRGLPFIERYRRARALLTDAPSNIVVSPLATTTSEKRALFEALIARNAEGIVFRRLSAAYDENAIKHKFIESCSVIVLAHNDGKRSVQIGVLAEDGSICPVGSVTIPTSRAIPSPTDIVEVEYLYWFGPQGSLFQPTYKGPRCDVDRDECRVTQLKRKPLDAAA